MQKNLSIKVSVQGMEEYKEQIEVVRDLMERLEDEIEKLNKLQLTLNVGERE